MFPVILSFFILSFSFHSFSSAKIVEAERLEQFQKILNNLNMQSLVMWDVDNMLIFMADKILSPGNELKKIEIQRAYFDGNLFANRIDLFSKILNKASFHLVEPGLADAVLSLQRRGIPTMAFTAMKTGSFGVIDSMEKWRIDQLNRLGIDFTNFRPCRQNLSWKGGANPLMGSPAFQAGVLCSDHLPKGPVLEKFLNTIHWKPSIVIFIDDTLECLISVKNTLKQLNIPYIGVHYHAVRKMNIPVDSEIAHFQFQYLAETGIWLTDAEAEQAMQ